MKIAARNLLMRGLAPLAQRLAPALRRRVISLHDIGADHRTAFVAKMVWLKKHFHVVSLADLYFQKNLNPQKTNVALTFDDAFLEHFTVVAPLLEELGLPATFFIPSSVLRMNEVEKRHFSKVQLRRSTLFDFMSEEQVALLAQNPLFEIGGHTSSHIDFGEEQEAAELEKEIVADKLLLEKITGRPLRFFAYPFGNVHHLSAEAIGMIQRAGYLAGLTIIPAYWRSDQNPYLWGRDSLDPHLEIKVWESFLKGGHDLIGHLKYASALKRLRQEVVLNGR